MKIGTKLTLIGIVTCGLIISSFAYVSYHKMAKMQMIAEQKELKAQHTIISNAILMETLTATKLATLVANMPPIQAAFAQQDRNALSQWLIPSFEIMQQKHRVEQFQFHLKGIPEQGDTKGQYSNALSFFRVHSPDKYGDDLSGFRKSVVATNMLQQAQYGFEKGVYGLGMRGIVPMFYEQKHLGSVEFGIRFDENFFNTFKTQHEIDAALYIAGSEYIATGQHHLDDIIPSKAIFSTFARTFNTATNTDKKQPQLLTTDELRTVLQTSQGITLQKILNGKSVAVYSKPIQDFSNKNIGVLSVIVDRSEYIAAQQDIEHLIILMVTLTLMGALIFIFIVKWMIEKPICHIATLMENIANGYLNEHLHLGKHSDEIAIMHHAVHHLSTKMRNMIDQIQAIILAAKQGDLTQRIETKNLQGFMKVLAEGTNELVANTALIMTDMKQMTHIMAEGHSAIQQTNGKGDNNLLYTSISYSTQRTVANLQNVINELKNELSQRTTKQAAILEDTSAVMQEFTASIQHNSEHVLQASELAFCATEVAKQGGYTTKLVKERMQQIYDSSDKISEITALIDSIAFQTNILALNAAVEAARVGDQGQGFMVVASEVKNLAQRTAAAAKEIKQLIEESVEDIKMGTQLTYLSGIKMDDIMSAITKVKDRMSEISATSQQQAQAIEHVNNAIARIDDMTQQNVVLVQKVEDNTNKLMQQAAKLQTRFGQFKLKIN